MGLWDKPGATQDGTLKELIGLPIHIQRIETRDVDTMYGPGTALDVYILVGDAEKMYSGFSAGILAQVKQATEGDFPCWARIENKPLRGNKSTLVLVPTEAEEYEQLGIGVGDDDDIPF